MDGRWFLDAGGNCYVGMYIKVGAVAMVEFCLDEEANLISGLSRTGILKIDDDNGVAMVNYNEESVSGTKQGMSSFAYVVDSSKLTIVDLDDGESVTFSAPSDVLGPGTFDCSGEGEEENYVHLKEPFYVYLEVKGDTMKLEHGAFLIDGSNTLCSIAFADSAKGDCNTFTKDGSGFTLNIEGEGEATKVTCEPVQGTAIDGVYKMTDGYCTTIFDFDAHVLTRITAGQYCSSDDSEASQDVFDLENNVLTLYSEEDGKVEKTTVVVSGVGTSTLTATVGGKAFTLKKVTADVESEVIKLEQTCQKNTTPDTAAIEAVASVCDVEKAAVSAVCGSDGKFIYNVEGCTKDKATTAATDGVEIGGETVKGTSGSDAVATEVAKAKEVAAKSSGSFLSVSFLAVVVALIF